MATPEVEETLSYFVIAVGRVRDYSGVVIGGQILKKYEIRAQRVS